MAHRNIGCPDTCTAENNKTIAVQGKMEQVRMLIVVLPGYMWYSE
jgi:hypothetical protein